MQKIKKLFGETPLSWRFIILFSVAAAVIVAVLNRIPVLADTSFSDPAIWLDTWIVLAIFIIVNCRSWQEAVCKCFVFFLISQPLIYLVEILVDVSFYGFDFAERFNKYFVDYYIGSGWLRLTILTVPGALIAYQIKKENVWAALVLSVATGFLAFSGSLGLAKVFTETFPRHLLYYALCLIFAVGLIFIILKTKKQKVLAVLLTILVAAACHLYIFRTETQSAYMHTAVIFDEGVVITDAEISDENIASISLDEDGSVLRVKGTGAAGSAEIKCTDSEGNIYIYTATATENDISVEEGN